MIRGCVIKELGLRRADLIITTKLFWGSLRWSERRRSLKASLGPSMILRERELWGIPSGTNVLFPWNALVLTMLTLSSLTVRMYQVRYSLLHGAIDDNSIRQ
jgi:hypothetical protein